MTRVALLDHTGSLDTPALAAALQGAGVEATVLGPRRAARAFDWMLARRGFAAGTAQAPFVTARLLRGDFDVAHALTGPDAVAALAWRRLTHRPVVFTCSESLSREVLADRRLRLWMLARATAAPDAVFAADAAVADAMWRWLALEVPVLDPPAYARLYGELLSARG